MPRYKLIFLCLLGASQAQAAGGTLAVVPAQPRAGRAVTLRYAPPAAGVQAGKPVKAVIYLYSDFAWRPDSLVLKPGAAGWQTTYTLPANCAFAALRFYQGPVSTAEDTDSLAQQGFYFVPRDKKGRKLPGGALGEAIYRMPSLDRQLPAFFPRRATPPAPAELTALLNEELARPGAAPRQFAGPYMALERAALGPEFKTKGGAALAPLQAALPEAETDLMELARIYRYELKDEAQASQVEAAIKQRYPHGRFARMQAYSAFTRNNPPEQILRDGEKFLVDFPAQELDLATSGQAHLYFETYRLLASTYFDAKAYNRMLAKRALWDFKLENEIYRWNITRAHAFKTMPLDTLYRVSTVLMQDLLAKANDNSYIERGVFTPAQAKVQAREQLDKRLITQIALLHDLHKDQEALGYFAHFSDQGRYADATTNELHLHLLDRLHRSADVVPLLESSSRANALTPALTARLKQEYQTSHKGLAGYDQYLATLRSPEEIAKLHAEVERNLTNHEYTPFALEDANGQLVRSSDWEGKIVVLDFWATWCGPCIRAFPGMQMLVDKYAKDPQVDFYFVGTMQEGDYKAKDINYLKQEGYRFKLLLDAVNTKTKEQDVVFRSFVPFFHSSGIPRKVILKDGIMRYTSEGYSGSPSQLAEEISYAIELLKKQ
jgi:thiol-disulfide isomerase/thioredoxin